MCISNFHVFVRYEKFRQKIHFLSTSWRNPKCGTISNIQHFMLNYEKHSLKLQDIDFLNKIVKTHKHIFADIFENREFLLSRAQNTIYREISYQ